MNGVTHTCSWNCSTRFVDVPGSPVPDSRARVFSASGTQSTPFSMLAKRKPGMPLEQSLGDDHHHEVVDQPVPHQRADDGLVEVQRRHRARLATALVAPRTGHRVLDVAIAVVEAGMAGHDESRLGHARPERIERRVRGRLPAIRGEHRARTHRDDPRAAVQHPLQLLDGGVEVGQRQVRRGEDPVLVGEAPLVVDASG